MSKFSKEFNDNFFKNITELYVDPEINRRREAGRLPDDFSLYAVQVIMNHDAPIEVRLNNEVQAYVIGSFAKDVVEGEEVSIGDLESISDIELTDADPNAGHITMVLHKTEWVGRFDLRYNADRSRKHAETSREFLDVARAAFEKGHLRAVAENLFHATELMAKSVLLLHDDQMLTSKKHGVVHSQFNRWRHLGNTEPRYAALLNKLTELRGSSRYLQGDSHLTNEEAKEMIGVADEMFKHSIARIPQDRRKRASG